MYDNFKVVTAKGLYGGFLIAKTAIENLLKMSFNDCIKEKRKISEYNPRYRYLCEPNLGRRGLYSLLGLRNQDFQSQKFLDFLQYSDGSNNLDEISKLIKVSLIKTKKIYRLLKKKKLLKSTKFI